MYSAQNSKNWALYTKFGIGQIESSQHHNLHKLMSCRVAQLPLAATAYLVMYSFSQLNSNLRVIKLYHLYLAIHFVI